MTTLQSAADRKTICVDAEEWIKNEENTNNRKKALIAQSNKNFEKNILKWVNETNITTMTARQSTFRYNIRFVNTTILDNWKNVLESHGYHVILTQNLIEVSASPQP